MEKIKYECGKCGQSVKKGTNFCTNCGTELNWEKESNKQRCANCGEVVDMNETFCWNCGKPTEYKLEEHGKPKKSPFPNTSKAHDATEKLVDIKKYGTVEAIRAYGCERSKSLTGKVVFSKYDDDYAMGLSHARTIVFLSKGWSELTRADKVSLLNALGIEDDPDKVIWWSNRPLFKVKSPRPPYEIWNYIDGFTYKDADIRIHRKVDLSKTLPKLECIKGGTETISRDDIDKERSSEISYKAFFWVGLVVVFIVFLWLIGFILGK